MDKLTIEQRAQKYNEALEKAMKVYNNISPENNIIKKILEKVFPELKNSKGERIRKAIIEGLREMKNSFHTISSINIDDCIAWLEKQGETIEINPSEFDLRLNKLLKQFKILPKDDIIDTLNFYLNVVRNDGTYKADENQSNFVNRKDLKNVEQNNRLLQYITKERNKVDFYYNNKKVSWNDIPYDVREHDYPYHFIGDLDCFPFFVDEY